ncbi:ST1A1-like protein [Mya arenaria]|uniref:ST1A1-like protein n=1 Tax=Mya arenaria TaxID=6604 RepID=A0ABY7F133_MYAAR|nr:ST1A1-like protein [Mya arenaria]
MTDQNAESYEIKSKDKPRFSMNRRVYKGVVMFDNEAELIETMDTRQDDIWVCSYPRSGTTLTQEMTYLVKTLDFETALTKQLDERFPIIDIKDDRFPYYKGVKHFDEMKSPRLIKSHLPYFLLPQQLKDGKGKIIYIARNAKDVVTSFYHLLLWGDELKESDNTWDLFLDSFMNGTAAYAVATTVMPAVTTVAPDTSACHDTESDAFKCAELDKYDFCHDTTSVAYSIAHEKCPKHCGFCGGTTVINIVVTIGGGTDADCVDVEDDQFKCADWLSFGFCDPASGAGYQVSKLSNVSTTFIWWDGGRSEGCLA